MKYKLYEGKSLKEYPSTEDIILAHRGVQDSEKWFFANMQDVSDWEDLDYIEEGVKVLSNCISENGNALIIVDCDVDGYTSAAILINYLNKHYGEWCENHLTYFHHEGKQHGLGDVCVLDGIDLIICPDSASNDYEQHEQLNNRNIKVLILDHHEAPQVSPFENTVTINNQLCDYKNKDFSGAGIVWQFCRAYEEIIFNSVLEDYLDLCALGNCGDMMNYRSIETRAIIKEGFKHIKNPFFYGMTEKNKFSIDKMGGINYMSIAFYVVPFVNATVRSGTAEEKDLVFRAMCTPYAFEKVESGKRGHKGEMVPLYEEAVRVVGNIKNRQTKLQDESMQLLEQKIYDNNLLDNAVLVLCCEPGEVEKNIAGLCANKIQAKYQRPTLVLTHSWDRDTESYYYRGSARNYSMCENQDFRQTCLETNLCDYAQGHANAFGFSVLEDNIENLNNKFNEIYKYIPKEPVYWVDYIWNMNQVNNEVILSVAEMSDYWGQEIPEAKIALNKIDLSQCCVTLMSPDKNPTLKVVLPNGLSLIKFKSSQEEYESFLQDNRTLNAIIKCNKNEWMGKVSAQGIIEEYELKKEWVF